MEPDLLGALFVIGRFCDLLTHHATGYVGQPEVAVVVLRNVEGTSAMHKLKLDVAGTILRDSSSQIDVGDHGYLPCRT